MTSTPELPQTLSRGHMLVSLGAKVMVECYFRRICEYAETKRINIEFCLLDTPELANIQTLLELSSAESSELLQKETNRVWGEISKACPRNVTISKWSDYATHPGFVKYFAIFRDLYDQNKSFRNHCHSQTFSNLAPILRKKGIRNGRDPVIVNLSGYLTKELALIYFLSTENVTDFFLAPRSKMEIQECIESGKYAELNECARRIVPTYIITT